MGKFCLGVGILAVFLALGIWTSHYSENAHTPISEALTQAAEAGLSGDWEQGIALGQQAKTAWEKNWRKVAAISDHAPMDEIDSLFAQLTVYGKTRSLAPFAACCNRISQLVDALVDAHAPDWWNIL